MHPIAIRGAITIEHNSAEEIKVAALQLIKEIIKENNIATSDIIMVFLTMTDDLTAYNASSAIRLGMHWDDVPFFTSQEPNIDGMLERCIRILLQCNSNKSKTEIKHIYLGKAAALRPDLTKNA